MIDDPVLPTRRFELARYPGIPQFALDLVAGTGEARSLLASSSSLHSYPDERGSLAEGLRRTNRDWGNSVDGPIQRWQQGARVLIAGQQVGMGGGPLYTLTKIASLIRLRERFRQRGEEAVAMFWMATEDHDYLEAANLLVATHRIHTRIRPPERPDPRHVVGTLPLPESARRKLLELFPDVPGSWLEQGVTFGDSFARLLASALRGHEVILVDSLLPELRRCGAPLFEMILDRWDEAERTIEKRSSAIEAAGYRAQIVNDEGHALLWTITDEGMRLPIRRRDGGFSVGEERWSLGNLRQLAHSQPERISTGALTRPLLQDFVFRSGIFVGGPAEVSYYAQCAALHELFRVPFPEVVLRGHVLVAPSRILEKMERHGFDPLEMFEDPDDVLARRSSDAISTWESSVTSAAEALESQITSTLERIGTAPPQMHRTVARSMSRMRYHLNRMQNRGSRALARRDRERTIAFERARSVLAPGGVPQDRVAGWLPWFAMFGDSLLKGLVECVEPHSMHVALLALEGAVREDADEL